MAWFSGKVSLGNFPDFSEAVSKLSESVKNIEKNFDTALGLEEESDGPPAVVKFCKTAPGIRSSAKDRKALSEPSEKPESSKSASPVKAEQTENDNSADNAEQQTSDQGETSEQVKRADVEMMPTEDNSGESEDKAGEDDSEHVVVSHSIPVEVSEEKPLQIEKTESADNLQEEKSGEALPALLESVQPESSSHTDHVESTDLDERKYEQKEDEENKEFPAEAPNASSNGSDDNRELSAHGVPRDKLDALKDNYIEVLEAASDIFTHQDDMIAESTARSLSDIVDSVAELEKVKKEKKMIESALQGAARQAQAKANEIAKLMNENEQLKAVLDDRRKTSEAVTESLREEFHQRVSALERKVYALTRERDTLRREQSKKSDAAALLKEKDEIINQVMAEGEELSKKQAAQESQMRKLRAQIRELEEEKKGLLTKLQVEENTVESIKRDKASTEKLLQETVENHQAEFVTQKEYYTNALNAAKEAEALAEARANTEARSELESRLKEAEDRESMLVQTLDELRQTLSRKEQQAVFREEMLRRDIEDLQKRYQASERRCEELVTQVPDSTRPLLRQVEAMQETAARRAEAWAAVERSLNSRLQEAEAKAATSEEKERSINERLTQTLSRINVLEAQISCLRSEQTQLTRSLEKERQRAAENRQEYLALKEEADTQEGRVDQLEDQIRELKRKHKEELHEALTNQELLQQELEREKAIRLDQEKTAGLPTLALPDKSSVMRQKSAAFENGLDRELSTATSLGSIEESYFLQTTLDSSENFSNSRSMGEGTMSPYYMKSMTSNTFEAALRQKEGELASYISRLASMESIRNSLAEELVKLTGQCEKLQAEAATLPGVRAELEALRRRHSAALELMGERDEELEELRADIVDVKEMYREQVNLLVNKIQRLNPSVGVP